MISSYSSFGFSHQGSPQRIFLLQLFLSSVSSSVTSTSAMSSFTTSINLLFGLPRFLFPGNSILSILLPIYPSSFLRRCPYHLSLASRVFSPNFPTCAVPLMYSFLILSILATPNENRNIFNSAISVSCLFVSATVSSPYNIAGLTATLCTPSLMICNNIMLISNLLFSHSWRSFPNYMMICNLMIYNIMVSNWWHLYLMLVSHSYFTWDAHKFPNSVDMMICNLMIYNIMVSNLMTSISYACFSQLLYVGRSQVSQLCRHDQQGGGEGP